MLDKVNYVTESFNNALERYTYGIESLGHFICRLKDLTVKFKCAGITTAYNFPVDAVPTLTATSGTVENGTIANADLSMNAFQEYTMTVKGADQSTVLTLESAEVTSSPFLDLGLTEEADYRFFVDDILITIAE